MTLLGEKVAMPLSRGNWHRCSPSASGCTLDLPATLEKSYYLVPPEEIPNY